MRRFRPFRFMARAMTSALLVWQGAGCDVTGPSNGVAVSLRNVDPAGIPVFLCVSGETNCDYRNLDRPMTYAELRDGESRRIVLPHEGGAMEGTFYAFHILSSDFYALRMIATCRTTNSREQLESSGPEVIWDGESLSCPDW